ncbi:MAG TPA: hypothetical protein VHJ76_07940 [Actinomycetota bacterium]|nr:hypothetical protein [Actinomycetota bacterium]
MASAQEDGAPRHVQLCHGAGTGAVCETTHQVRGPHEEHEVAAVVTNHRAGPVENVRVELRETGLAVFVPAGTSSIIVTTGPDGVARGILWSERFGTSTIVAEIDPPGTAGSTRGPAPDDDECEQPAGPGGSPPAGNCVSGTLTVSWESIHRTACNDGVDNDGDGFVDYDEDPGCTSVEDDSETPAPHPDPVFHRRTVAVRFAHDEATGALLVYGRVREADDFRSCIRRQTVRIQRREDGRWVTLKTATTNRRGLFAQTVGDGETRYRARVLRMETFFRDTLHICRRASKSKPHRHRG